MAMKRPNGTGSVIKLSGKRRKPYLARITKEYVYNEATGRYKQVYHNIGTFEKRKDADIALAEYNSNPYNLDYANMTFEEIYEQWWSKFSKKLQPQSYNAWNVSYRRCEKLYKVKFVDLTLQSLEACVNDVEAITTKKRVKSLLVHMFNFADRYGIVKRNYAELIELPEPEPIQNEDDEEEGMHTPYAFEEIATLISNVDKVDNLDLILIMIYTGVRNKELRTLKLENIHMNEDYFVCGVKTAAGKRRTIPIHEHIKPLLQARYDVAVSKGHKLLLETRNGTPLQYTPFANKLKTALSQVGLEHLPHDTRHTFSTIADEAKIDKAIVRQIVGHKQKDVTEAVYIHRSAQRLVDEVNKISWYSEDFLEKNNKDSGA